MTRFLLCPQCGISRFMVKNDAGDFIVVQVTREKVIVPINSDNHLEGYNLELLLCLGCSWKGTINELVRYYIG